MTKYERRARARLAKRVKAYEETCAGRSDSGKGFRRPGSLKLKR